MQGGGSVAPSESARLEKRKRRLVRCRMCRTSAVAHLSSRLEPTAVVDSKEAGGTMGAAYPDVSDQRRGSSVVIVDPKNPDTI